MLNFAGIDVESLYKVDSEYYAKARDQLLNAVEVRLGTLKGHGSVGKISYGGGMARHVLFLSELQEKCSKIEDYYDKIYDHIDKYKKLRTPPVNMRCSTLTEDEADTLVAYTLQSLPDLVPCNRALDEDELLIFVTQGMLREPFFKGDINDSAALKDYVIESRDFFDMHTSSQATHWSASARELLHAAREKSMVAARGYLHRYRKEALQVEHGANDVYVASLHVAYLIDLYLYIKKDAGIPAINRFKQSIEIELSRGVRLLLAAPEPNTAANEEFAKIDRRMSRCCPGIFTCFNSSKSHNKTKRDQEIENVAPKEFKGVRRVCGLSVW